MSATSSRTAHESQQPAEPTPHRGPTAFDIEKVHGPFKADIAQLAHAVRRLLDSGTGVGARPLIQPSRCPPTPTCNSGGFERVM